jgi:hypothetical protein
MFPSESRSVYASMFPTRVRTVACSKSSGATIWRSRRKRKRREWQWIIDMTFAISRSIEHHHQSFNKRFNPYSCTIVHTRPTSRHICTSIEMHCSNQIQTALPRVRISSISSAINHPSIPRDHHINSFHPLTFVQSFQSLSKTYNRATETTTFPRSKFNSILV